MIGLTVNGRDVRRHPGQWFVAVALATCAAIGPVSAQTSQPVTTQTIQESLFGGWRFELVPYMWFAGINADIKSGRLAGNGLEVSFKDIWNDLNFALMGSFGARKERWGILFDGIYLHASGDKPTPGPITRQVDMGLTTQIYSLAPEYRVFEDGVMFDVLAGVRYVSGKVDLSIAPGQHPLVLAGRSVSDSVSLWGGFGGARIAWPLPFAKEFSLVGYLDAGALNGKFMWQGIAGVNWQISETWSAKAGYRYLDLKLKSKDVDWNLNMGGPYLGVGIQF